MNYVTVAADGEVGVVTLNRPERLNAIGLDLLAQLHAALAEAQADPATRVLVLAGAGRAFCAGDDLKEFDAQASSAESMAQMGERIQQITRDIMLGPKPVIGAAQGYAVGGGLEWLLNCDLVVASDTLVGFFPEMSLGHFVTGGVTHLLPLAVGRQRAMEMLLLGERHDAQALWQLGLVNRVVAPEALMPTALALARQVAQRSAGAMARLKRVLAAQAGAALEQALILEQDAALACFADPDTARRVRGASPARAR
ncbi:MAG: enoyl-CoA hydratase/isomerase family protein [Ramlibacter sp.]|nr:enoyl-CoA hydratase/isomerase family protein [Ramlibacter sp.]